MHQVQDFKANFTQVEMAETKTDNPVDYEVDGAELYDTDSSARNVCFVWEDGRRAFFNYAYLQSVDLIIIDSLNVMLLYFSGQVVTIKGYQLEKLFSQLLNHKPKIVAIGNSRYALCLPLTKFLIIEVSIQND